MKYQKKAVLLAGILILALAALLSCASQQVAPEKPQAEQQVAQAAVEPAPPPPPPVEEKPKSLYETDVKPLTPAQCGSCHFSVFDQIRNQGGKHKLDCTQCHVKYHAYNPVKQNWKEIMPQCQTCHGNFHGEKHTNCMQCHNQPHAPKQQMAVSAELMKVCNDCHGKVGQELQSSPSKHTKVACSTCHHQKHGYIPSCMECHKPHTPAQTVKECLGCHPVHSPLKIAYAKETPNNVCGACHAPVYKKLEASSGKHRMVACAQCHPKHRQIPKCEECHGKPHGEGLLKKFPNCNQCHVDVHDLPALSAK
ncbi:MAG: cytochrome C [Nitrospirota bacterium]